MPFGTWLARGKIGTGLRLVTPGSGVQVTLVDRDAQEDARRLTWAGTGDGAVALTSVPSIDLARESNGQLAIEIDARVDAIGDAPVIAAMQCGPQCGRSATASFMSTARRSSGRRKRALPGSRMWPRPTPCSAPIGTLGGAERAAWAKGPEVAMLACPEGRQHQMRTPA